MSFDPRIHVIGWEAGQDGSAFYRISEPIRNLPPDRFTGESSESLSPKWVHADVVVGQRVSKYDEEAQPVIGWLQVCRDNDVLSIYEMDDNLFAVPEHNPSYDWWSREEVQHNMRACITAADMVSVSTEPLAEVVRKINPAVTVIPNYIDDSVLTIPRPHERDRVVVGWAGSKTHDADFVGIKPQIFNMLFSHPDTVFMTIGADYTTDLPPERRIRKPWVKSVKRTYRHIAEFDIGIAPLANDEFNESKSHIKMLEYAALGIPAIASNTPSYEDFVIHGVTGFLADTPTDWADYLEVLVSDPDLRERMGKAAREHAASYTLQGHIDKYERLFSQ